MDEETYSIEEAAKVLDRTPGRIRQLLRDGELEGIPPEQSGERGWKILKSSVDARSGRTPPGEPGGPGPEEAAAEEPAATGGAQDRRDVLIEELMYRVRSLGEANRENRRIIAGLVQRVPELEAPSEARESPESDAEEEGRWVPPKRSAAPGGAESSGANDN